MRSEVKHTKAVEAVEARPERWECDGINILYRDGYYVMHPGDEWSKDSLRHLHAILSEILSPSVPPSPTVPYVPRVNDVVRWDGWDKSEFLIQRIDPESPGYCHIHTVRVSGDKKGMAASFGAFGEATFMFVREATEEDKRVAAGLDATVPPSDAPTRQRCIACGGYGTARPCPYCVRTVAAPTPAATTSEARPMKCPTCGSPDRPLVCCPGMHAPDDHDATCEPCWDEWHDARVANAAKPTTPAATTSEATDPRRVVGAVTITEDREEGVNGYLRIVRSVNPFRAVWLDKPETKDEYAFGDKDPQVFVRWATPDECKAHGIPYVERGATTSEARPTWGPGVLAVEEAYRPAPAAKPTPPDATTSEATDPRRVVGAVVHGQSSNVEYVVITPTGVVRRADLDNTSGCGDLFPTDVFVRWATREECERHGIPYVERGAAKPTTPAADEAEVDEAKEREAFDKWRASMGWRYSDASGIGFQVWLARARSGAGR